MEKILFEIKNQIFETGILISDYLKGVNPSTILLGFALFYAIFMRRWEIKKTISFLVCIFLLFVLLVRIESFLGTTFGAEGSFFSIGVGRTVFLILAAAIFIYNALIKD